MANQCPHLLGVVREAQEADEGSEMSKETDLVARVVVNEIKDRQILGGYQTSSNRILH